MLPDGPRRHRHSLLGLYELGVFRCRKAHVTARGSVTDEPEDGVRRVIKAKRQTLLHHRVDMARWLEHVYFDVALVPRDPTTSRR